MKLHKCDTHIHTSETSPCGNVGAAELVELYSRKDYDTLVITDHYFDGFFEPLHNLSWEEKIDLYLKGFNIAREEGKKVGINVLLGMEIRFKENYNDYLVYGFNENFLRQNKELYNLSLSQFRILADKNNLLIYQAHPFRSWVAPAPPHLLNGIEVFNGNPRHNSNNDKAYEYAVNHQLKFISGSDFHELEDLARGGIILPELVDSSEDFVKLLRENKDVALITSTAF